MNTLIKLFPIKFVASALGLLYSILQVRYFGASRTIEVYFAAQSLVYLVTSLTQGGQLAEIFLPEFHKLNNKKTNLGYAALNVVINRMVIYGSIIIFAVFVFAPFFVGMLVPGFANEDKQVTILIFRILLPYLYLQLMVSFFITVLNAEKKFGRAELLGLTGTIVNILCLVILYNFVGIWALVVALLLGKIIEFVFYFFQLHRLGYRYKFLLKVEGFDHSTFFQTMKSTLLYVGATQIYNIVLTASISFLPEGVFAIFKYVQNLTNKAKGLFIQPFLTIFFTSYSNLLHGLKAVHKTFTNNLSNIININVITLIGAMLTGDIIINLIWGGKKFDLDDVKLAYVFLLFNVVAMLISSIGSIYRKMAVSHGRAKLLYLIWVFAQLGSALASYFLIKFFKVNGLFFIIPINAFLMGMTSYLIYNKILESERFNFFNRNIFFGLVLVALAAVFKFYFSGAIYIEDSRFSIPYYLFFAFILSIYPIFSIYKTLKSEKNSG